VLFCKCAHAIHTPYTTIMLVRFSVGGKCALKGGLVCVSGQPQAAVLMVSRGVAARDLGLMISYKFESNTKLSRVSGG